MSQNKNAFYAFAEMAAWGALLLFAFWLQSAVCDPTQTCGTPVCHPRIFLGLLRAFYGWRDGGFFFRCPELTEFALTCSPTHAFIPCPIAARTTSWSRMQLQTLLSPGMAARPGPPVAVSWVFVIPSVSPYQSLSPSCGQSLESMSRLSRSIRTWSHLLKA
jgi:hypothetical protein